MSESVFTPCYTISRRRWFKSPYYEKVHNTSFGSVDDPALFPERLQTGPSPLNNLVIHRGSVQVKISPLGPYVDSFGFYPFGDFLPRGLRIGIFFFNLNYSVIVHMALASHGHPIEIFKRNFLI